MQYYLASMHDPAEPPVRITKPRFVIGRAEDCDLRLVNQFISRRHAELRQHGDWLHVRDLGSRNGTAVNGQPVEHEVTLDYGDVVSFGVTAFVVRVAPTDGLAPAHRIADFAEP
jgi:pSer/pThr/pTyr-binding forkhead associated (FHA) protein